MEDGGITVSTHIITEARANRHVAGAARARAGLQPSCPIQSHGWDAHTQSWRGPDEFEFKLEDSRHLLQRLRRSAGAWHGKLTCRFPGEMPASFFTTIYDLGDSGVAMIDLEDSGGPPVEILAVVPHHRVSKIRTEFAFEFVSFLRFVRVAGTGSELAIHDYIEQTLREADGSSSLVFSIDAGVIPLEMSLVMSVQSERLAAGMLQWLSEKDRAGA